jgi:hypothetical protein
MSHSLKANYETWMKQALQREIDTLEETFSTHVTMDDIFVGLIVQGVEFCNHTT